jgi:hypothetical protein
MTMFPVNFDVRPDVNYDRRVSLSPDGAPAGEEPDGDINLYEQASLLFARLGENNRFDGEVNTFRQVVVDRIQTRSDVRHKSQLVPADGASAAALVRRVPAYRYRMGGEPGAGVLAQDVPAQYTRRHPGDGSLTVDYQALFAELWTCVRHLQDRLDGLDGLPREQDDLALQVPRDPQHAGDEGDPGLEVLDPVGVAAAAAHPHAPPQGVVRAADDEHDQRVHEEKTQDLPDDPDGESPVAALSGIVRFGGRREDPDVQNAARGHSGLEGNHEQ